MSFSDWENVESGEALGTIKGRLPLENAATAFAYRKEIILQVFLTGEGFGITYKDLRGQWKVRIRSGAQRDKKNEAYIDPILFEQTITWTARVTALNFGGLSLVTWQPLGDGGSGKQETSIVETQLCATLPDINTASDEQLEKYGETGAWRFLALGRTNENTTPRQKYDQERGFTLFTPEGAATAGGYHFFATWQSPYYRCFIPPGGILETVFDTWQTGQLTTEAFYTFSSQQTSSSGALFDTRTGSHWRIFSDVSPGGSTGTSNRSKVWRSRQIRSLLTAAEVDFDGAKDTSGLGIVEPESRLQGLQILNESGGILIALGATGGTASVLRLFLSRDQGEHWKRIMNQPLDIIPMASCLSQNGATLTIYGTNATGRATYAVLSFGQVNDEAGKPTTGWNVRDSGEAKGKDNLELPTKGISSLTACEGGVLRLAALDSSGIGSMILLVSRDAGRTYEREVLT